MRSWLVVAMAGSSLQAALGARAATTVERTLLSNLQSLRYKPQIEHVGTRTQYSIQTRDQGLGVPIQLSLSEGRLNIWMLVKLYPFPRDASSRRTLPRRCCA